MPYYNLIPNVKKRIVTGRKPGTKTMIYVEDMTQNPRARRENYIIKEKDLLDFESAKKELVRIVTRHFDKDIEIIETLTP